MQDIFSKEGFDILYEKYASKALRFAKAITCNSELAADAVQEAFIRVYMNQSKFDISKEFEPWFLKIVSNESKRQLKKNKQYIELDENIKVDDNKTDDDLSMQKALIKLRLDQRQILTLKYLLGYSESDISQILKKPLGTVKSRLYKAREELKKIIIKEGSL